MSNLLLEKEETQVSPTSHADLEITPNPRVLSDINVPLKPTPRPVRRRNITGKEISLLAVASVIMAALLVLGVIFSQPTAPRQSAAPSGNQDTMAGMNDSSTSTSSAPTSNVPAHQTYNAQAPATPQGSVVNLKLVVKEALVSIAPGVAYHAWTFNGTVPGPVLRVRQGQTVHFTLVNDGTMPHSIDFHAAQTPWNVNYQPVAAGKSFSFDWKANYPGVFMYHCGTAPAMYHISNGMYGGIIVDPASSWAPAQEYVLVQSEFYTHLNSDGTYSVDPTKMMNTTPDYVVFNGYADQYKAAPLTAKAGQRIRLFIMNAGPSEFSAFHVIGGIFSDVYIDGNPANHMVGDQTVTIPPGGGVVVELTIPAAGLYPFVTHSFSAVDRGALGVIKVTP